MKYYLLCHGETPEENSLFAFEDPADRDTETILRIFGADLGNQDEAEQWDKMRADLNGKGVLTFEGDPGLEWFTAIPVGNADAQAAYRRGIIAGANACR